MIGAMLWWLLAAGPTWLPVRFHVAEGPAGPVVTEAWLDAQVASANRIFNPHGLGFVRVAVVPLPAAHARLETRADRNALAPYLASGEVNAFIVESLRDVDDPSRLRQGVHWWPKGRKAGRRPPHLVIVAAYAGPTVLAHELGHFFGHPHHTTVQGNIMSYDRGPDPPTLDTRQGRRMARVGKKFVATRELVPAPPPEPAPVPEPVEKVDSFR